MTREEAIAYGKRVIGLGLNDETQAFCELAIKTLEQEPCEDAVSRAEVKKIAKEMYLEVANMELDAKTISDCISCTSSKCREVLERKLQALPPVTPQEPNTWSLDDAREGKNESRCEEIVRIIDGKA